MDFTQRKARSEIADRCFGGDATFQQFTAKVICFLHTVCDRIAVVLNAYTTADTLSVLVTEADFSAFSRTGRGLLRFARKYDQKPF
jgi:hypothetical protein